MTSLYKGKCFSFINGSYNKQQYDLILVNFIKYLSHKNLYPFFIDFNSETKEYFPRFSYTLNYFIEKYKRGIYPVSEEFKSNIQNEKLEEPPLIFGNVDGLMGNCYGVEALDFCSDFVSHYISPYNRTILVINFPYHPSSKVSSLQLGFLKESSTVVFFNDEKEMTTDVSFRTLENNWKSDLSQKNIFHLFYKEKKSENFINKNEFVFHIPPVTELKRGIETGQDINFDNPQGKNHQNIVNMFNIILADGFSLTSV